VIADTGVATRLATSATVDPKIEFLRLRHPTLIAFPLASQVNGKDGGGKRRTTYPVVHFALLRASSPI
jgi:hypothetical protein